MSRLLRLVTSLLLLVFLAVAAASSASASVAAAPLHSRVLPSSPVLVKVRSGSAKMAQIHSTATRILKASLTPPVPVDGWSEWFIVGSADVSASFLAAELASLGLYDAVEPLGVATIDTDPRPTPVASSWTDNGGTDAPPSALWTPSDALYASQYAHAKMQVARAHDLGRGAGVLVAVLDTGVDLSHPDLVGRTQGAGRDFISGHANAQDDHGHGTHVAGIIGAATDNGQGIAAVAPASRILPVKVLAQNGSGDYAAIASGIRWAVDSGATIINMSLGGSCTGATLLGEAVAYARGRNVLIIAAAGNSASSIPACPASLPGVLGVGATDERDQRASFSNYGAANAKIAGPGVGILSTMLRTPAAIWNATGYGPASGTSMAAPNVAGVAALLRAAQPSLGEAAVANRLIATGDAVPAVDVGPRVNALRALEGAAPAPTPRPTEPVATTVPPVPGNCASGSYADQLVCLINAYRVSRGLPPMRRDGRLDAAGDFHNRWMRDNNCFSHNCPGEPPVMTRMRNAGYPIISGGENIGKGYIDPPHMLAGWQNSSGHNAALLNTIWPDIGCAYLRGASGQNWDSYWSCEFARGDTSAPSPTRPIPTATLFLPTITRTAVPPTATTVLRTPAPGATATLRPVPPSPTPDPTGGTVRYAALQSTAVNRAQQLAAELCANTSVWGGVTCTAGPGTTYNFLDIRLDTRIAPLAARSRMVSLCSGTLGGVTCQTRPN